MQKYPFTRRSFAIFDFYQVRLICSDGLIYTGRHKFRRHASPQRVAAVDDDDCFYYYKK